MMTTRRGCLYTKLFNKKTNEKHLVQSDNLPASEIGLCIRYMCFSVCVCVRAMLRHKPMFYGVCTCDKSTQELKCFSTMLKAMCQH